MSATAGFAVTDRDTEVLRWIGRWRHVTARQVHRFLHVRPDLNPRGTAPGRSVVYDRLGKLVDGGLLSYRQPVRNAAGVYAVTRAGLSTVAMTSWWTPRWSWTQHRHEVEVVDAALHYQAQGLRVVSEREMRQDARLGVSIDGVGRDRWTVPVPGRDGVDEHHPDLWVLPSDADADRQAVEMELSAKAAARLRRILDGYGRLLGRGRLQRVVYLSDDAKVRDAVTAVGTDLSDRHDALQDGLVVRAWTTDRRTRSRS